MEFKKNQIVELYIDDIGNEGEGIGHIDGYVPFFKRCSHRRQSSCKDHQKQRKIMASQE